MKNSKSVGHTFSPQSEMVVESGDRQNEMVRGKRGEFCRNLLLTLSKNHHVSCVLCWGCSMCLAGDLSRCLFHLRQDELVERRR